MRRFVMCRPTHFDVRYVINPWMNLDTHVDNVEALRQWHGLKARIEALGHHVDVIDPPEDHPDLVFIANSGVVIGDIALGSRFHHPERRLEAAVYRRELARLGIRLEDPTYVNEGQGDFLVRPASTKGAGLVLAGYGPRTERAAHQELAELFGIDVVSLELVDDRFYHLDTACSILDERTILYVPDAFAPASLRVLCSLFDRRIALSDDDAAVLGANAISDGSNVIFSDRARSLGAALRASDFNPLPVAMGEFMKSGGGPRCCVLECF